MAEQSFHDVVDQSQSVGDLSPADVLANKTTDSAADAASGETTAALNSNDDFNHYTSEATGTPSDKEGAMDMGGLSDTKPSVNGVAGVNDVHAYSSTPDEGPFVNGVKESGNNDWSESAHEASIGQTGVDGGAASEVDLAGKDPSDLQENTRLNSVKKPATFKAVSVTKSFLAKAGTTSNPTSKTSNEKANVTPSNTALQSGSRPRLVAKSASGPRGSTPKSLNMGSRAGRGSGPDPNQVWNRNRVAAPQATPKHLTDEELKQQYGIHLASRLQEDGEGKEAKWADIDDDEDDWIPETIEWNDGTKITLSQNEAPAVLAEENGAALAAKRREDEEEEAERSRVPPAKPTTTVGPNATVLKVGSSGQPKIGGLVLKTPSEKPTLVAKPPAPAPTKSPWASLPPVEKVSPIPAHPPTQPPSRFSQKDPHGFDAMPPPPSPAKEIAADDFTRSRRDNQNGIPRELFNSQSGRYEPVGEGRRGSMRKDQNFRPPSVLQRPSQGDHHGPAEPSPAFQTNRFGSQQEVGIWPRRRASSNLSGDGLNQGRRMSLSKASDLPHIPNESQRHDLQRDQSPLAHGLVSAKHGPRDVSPAQTHGSSIVESPTLATTQQVVPPNSAALEGTQVAVAVQSKLMREKREEAIKRKKEEEEKEAAEKKERIRLKLEKLGGPSVNVKKEPKAAAIEVPSLAPQPPTQPPEISRSPPKPPVPDKSGEPKQYGMMKVHGPHVINGLLPNGETSHKEPLKSPGLGEKAPHRRASPKGDAADQVPVSQVNGDGKKGQSKPSASTSTSPETRQPEILANSKQPSWKEVQSNSTGYAPWSSPSMTTHSSANGNVWGPPTHHRGIGNGTFDGNVQRPQSRQPSYQQPTVSPAPQPIAPPKIAQPSLGAQDLNNISKASTRSGIEDAQTIPTFPSPEPLSLPSSNKGTDLKQVATQQKSDQLHPQLLPRLPDVPDRPARSEPPRSGISAWANFPTQAAHDDNEKSLKIAQEQAAQRAQEERTGIKQEVQLPSVNETWRQVKVNDQVGQRSIVGALKTQNAATQHQTPVQPIVDDLRSISLPRPAHPIAATGAGRSSRFFPPMGPGILAQNQRAASHTIGYNRSASPPPPDSISHPVFSGANERPLVNIPKPKPTVKLPPSVKAPASIVRMPETRTSSLRAVSQPLVNNPSWQDRFNNLFGVAKPSLEKSTVPTIHFSASKVPLDLTLVDDNAAVALPPSDELTYFSPEIEAVTSKNMEDEDALFEERDFGSVPTVRIPANAPMAIWDPAKAPKPKRPRSKFFPEIQICSIDYFEFGLPDVEANGFRIPIRVPGFVSTKFKVMPSLYASVRSTQQFSSPNRKAGKPFKSRNPSANYGSSKQTKNEPSKPQTPNAQNVPVQQPRQKTNNGQNWNRRSSRIAQ